MNTFGMQVGDRVLIESAGCTGTISAFTAGDTPADPVLATVRIGASECVAVPVTSILPEYR